MSNEEPEQHDSLARFNVWFAIAVVALCLAILIAGAVQGNWGYVLIGAVLAPFTLLLLHTNIWPAWQAAKQAQQRVSDAES
ncbi:MAG TPA: hypothetical protein VG992_00080 [Candidatus Saccharimonadales bacterium]|nr:hypothetical protein [Candidatus Saccharimonadales bacterium]